MAVVYSINQSKAYFMKRFVLFILIGLYTSSVYAQYAMCEKYAEQDLTWTLYYRQQTDYIVIHFYKISQHFIEVDSLYKNEIDSIKIYAVGDSTINFKTIAQVGDTIDISSILKPFTIYWVFVYSDDCEMFWVFATRNYQPTEINTPISDRKKKSYKIMKDGQIIIRHDEKEYDILGRTR